MFPVAIPFLKAETTEYPKANMQRLYEITDE